MLHFEKIVSHPNHKWVVFIHGAGGSSKTWSHQVEKFRQHFNLLLIDLRDHGRSKNLRPNYEKYEFSIISNDIRQVLEHESITRAHFVTMSFGSVLLQDLAMRFPGMVDKCIISGGIFRGNLPIRVFVNMARFFNTFLSYPRMYGIFSYLLMPRKRNQKARRVYKIQAQKLTQKEYMKWIGLYSEFFALLKNFYNQVLNFQTLVIMGSDDYIFLKSARGFVSKQSNARLIEIPQTGHICNIESPGTFNDLCQSFLLDQ